MPCYFQGCVLASETKEHIPPRAFFPSDQRDQLLTVPSCRNHNNAKSRDDQYVLAHICINAAPAGRARDVFFNTIAPQLDYNKNSFRKLLATGSVRHPNGVVAYPVNIERFDRFFSTLSCGIVYKACKDQLPDVYRIGHVYHRFVDDSETQESVALRRSLEEFYDRDPIADLKFGSIKTMNTDIYSVKVFGRPGFQSSITIVHEFFEVFRVTSMLTKPNYATVAWSRPTSR